jgi:hypothetical protein
MSVYEYIVKYGLVNGVEEYLKTIPADTVGGDHGDEYSKYFLDGTPVLPLEIQEQLDLLDAAGTGATDGTDYNSNFDDALDLGTAIDSSIDTNTAASKGATAAAGFRQAWIAHVGTLPAPIQKYYIPQYQHGGAIPGSGPVPITAHGGEYVLTKGDTGLMRDLISAINKNGLGGGVTVESIVVNGGRRESEEAVGVLTNRLHALGVAR